MAAGNTVEAEITNMLFSLCGNAPSSGFDRVTAVEIGEQKRNKDVLEFSGHCNFSDDMPEVMSADAVYAHLGGETGLVDPVLGGSTILACIYGCRAGRHQVMKRVATHAARDMIRQCERSAATRLLSLRVALLECGLLENDTNVIFDRLGQVIADAAGITEDSIESIMKPLLMETLPDLLSEFDDDTKSSQEGSGHFIFHVEAVHANDMGALTVVSIASLEKMSKWLNISSVSNHQRVRFCNVASARTAFVASLQRLSELVSVLRGRHTACAVKSPAPYRSLMLLTPVRNTPKSHSILITQECFRLKKARDLARVLEGSSETEAERAPAPVGKWKLVERLYVLPSPSSSEASWETGSLTSSNASSHEMIEEQEALNDDHHGSRSVCVHPGGDDEYHLKLATLRTSSRGDGLHGGRGNSHGGSHAASLGGSQSKRIGAVGHLEGGSVNLFPGGLADGALAGTVAVGDAAGPHDAISAVERSQVQARQEWNLSHGLGPDSPRTMLLKHLRSAEVAFEAEELLNLSKPSEEHVQRLLAVIVRVQNSYRDTIDLTRRFLQRQVQSINNQPPEVSQKHGASTGDGNLTTGSDVGGMKGSAAYHTVASGFRSSMMTTPSADLTHIPATLPSIPWQWHRASQNFKPPSTAPSTANAHWQTFGSAGVPLGSSAPPAPAVHIGMNGDSGVSQLKASSESPRRDDRNSPRRFTLSGSPTQSDIVQRSATDVRRSIRCPSRQSERAMGKSSHATPQTTPENLAQQLTNETGRCLSNPPLLQSQSAKAVGPITPVRNHTHTGSVVSPQTPFRAAASREVQRTSGPTGSRRAPEQHQDSTSLTVYPGYEHVPPRSPFSTFISAPVVLAQSQPSPRRCNKADGAHRSPSTPVFAPSAKRVERRHSSGRSSPTVASLSWVQPLRHQAAAMETTSLSLSLDPSPRLFREGSPGRRRIFAQQEGTKLPVFGCPSRSVLGLPQLAHVSRSLPQKATRLQ